MDNYTFYSAFEGSRPIVSDEKTRRFAHDSLNAVYGRGAMKTPCVYLDDVEDFEQMPLYDKYDTIVKKIATDAPLRFAPDELIVGSASLGDAIAAVLPARYHGETVMYGVSHLTCGFDRVLREGLDSYEKRINERLGRPCDENQRRFLLSLQNVCSALHIWHSRYLAALSEKISDSCDKDSRSYYSDLYENLCRVPANPPKTFREGIQSLWFLFAFTRICGNWSGIGRFDYMLGGLYEHDIAEGKITRSEARELIAHFFIKGCEWIKLDSRGSGDAQHYQNIVLGGCDENGNDITNPLTYLVLEITEEFPISDFPIAVRINENSPRELIELISRVMRHGNGVAAVYNEKLIIDSLVEFGYPLREARLFANDGCWEVQVPGKTCFSYHPMDMYQILQNDVLRLNTDETVDYPDFESLYGAFRSALNVFMENWHNSEDSFARNTYPRFVVALFEDDCIENACDYMNRGARYNVISPHFGGVPDTSDCLYAIKKLVYEEKSVTLPKLCNILKNNWEGEEELRLHARRDFQYYGNDCDESDSMIVRVMDDYMAAARTVKERSGVLRPAGISTFGRQIEWKDIRMAGAHGYKSGEILASNLSPTPGKDMNGATAVIRSHCKIDLSKLTCGTALDIKLSPLSVKGECGINAIAGLILGFINLGGFFMQIDVMDNAVLLDAQLHPENYPNLSVKISGWSARFVTLDDNWQRMIIERT